MENRWLWPLPDVPKKVPMLKCHGAFGVVRKHDTHTGVDLYAPEGSHVRVVEFGVVVGIECFTGQHAGSPWWNDTKAVLVEGRSGVVCYGEIDPCVRVGSTLLQGELIGNVVRVLKKDKGLPTSMLHIELYAPGTRATEWWRNERPKNLLDPTSHLLNSW